MSKTLVQNTKENGMHKYTFTGDLTLADVDFIISAANEPEAIKKAIEGEYDTYSDRRSSVDIVVLHVGTIHQLDKPS